MNPGDVILISIPQFAGGPGKLRPALLLSVLPGAFQSMLICGISSRVDQLVNEWDERIRLADADFARSGLHRGSSIRLSYLRNRVGTQHVGGRRLPRTARRFWGPSTVKNSDLDVKRCCVPSHCASHCTKYAAAQRRASNKRLKRKGSAGIACRNVLEFGHEVRN